MENQLIICFYNAIFVEFWSLVLCLFGVQWVMITRIVDMLSHWKGRFARHGNSDVRIMVK